MGSLKRKLKSGTKLTIVTVSARAAGAGGVAGGQHQGQGEARLQQRGEESAARQQQVRTGKILSSFDMKIAHNGGKLWG